MYFSLVFKNTAVGTALPKSRGCTSSQEEQVLQMEKKKKKVVELKDK